MGTTVYGIAASENQAVKAADRICRLGVHRDDISILWPDMAARHDVRHDNTTKSPEGAAAGASTGLLVGGIVGWMAGIGALAIPGLGPFIAAGPILAALSGAAVGGTVGGVTGALVGAGIPEYEAKQYEGRLREGKILLAAYCADSERVSRLKEIFEQEGLEDISTGSPVESSRPVTAGSR